MPEYHTLGSYDSNGVPNYLHDVATVPPDLVERIINTLPERSDLTSANPEYISDSATRNIIIKSEDSHFTGADVYVTFLFEGAGYRNTVGYYYYPLHGDYLVPTKSEGSGWTPMTYSDRNSDSLNKTIIFPSSKI